ncbi:MAG: hypothetical protein QOF76_2471 [Solirubrobacteraceae bacterium]|nr:hypothetical protein [Solirubrobacteraceae bacterium]
MRAAVLPVLAIALVAAVLGVQRARGGGDYVPLKPANPCVVRPPQHLVATLESVAERVVLLGLDEAGCRLGLSRERLLLSLADPRTIPPGAAAALQGGLARAVDRLAAQGILPKVSVLLPEALDQSGLPGIAQDAIEKIPDGVVDDLLPSTGLLHRAIGGLDLNVILHGLGDPKLLDSTLRDAILAAAQKEIKAQLVARIPGPLRDILGL